jgi:hypothetical protein
MIYAYRLIPGGYVDTTGIETPVAFYDSNII